MPKLPPLFEWPIAPVSGLLAEMSKRLVQGVQVRRLIYPSGFQRLPLRESKT